MARSIGKHPALAAPYGIGPAMQALGMYGQVALMIQHDIAEVFTIPKHLLEENMGCRFQSEYRNRLRDCGCNRCRDEYHRHEDEDYRRHYVASGRGGGSNDYSRGLSALDIVNQITLNIGKDTTNMADIVPTKPIENTAIRLLTQQLTTRLANRAATQSSLDSYKAHVATYSAAAKAQDKEIGDLTKALKKLGHTPT